MTIPECIQAYHRFFALAERLFGEGDERAGCEMLYGALTQVIIAIAVQRGARYAEHQHRRRIIRDLATELDDQTIGRNFAAAQRIHVHFYLNNRETANLNEDIDSTRGLINRLLPLTA